MGISSVAHHNLHTKVFIVYLLMQELFFHKIHFFNVLSMRDKPWLDQLKITTAARGTSFSWKDSVPLVQGTGNTNIEGVIPCAKNKYEASATYQAH